jgi:hypothetical protein
MQQAAQEATLLRINSGGEVSSHGRMHMGLAAAHLGMAEEAFGRLEAIVTGGSMYDSLMCSHEPDSQIFNVDANGAIPEIVNRMLVRSHPGSLDLLPALPEAWPKGEIRGLRVRQQITVKHLAWNTPGRTLSVELVSDRDQEIDVRVVPATSTDTMTVTGEAILAEDTECRQSVRRLHLLKSESAKLDISWEPPT